MILLNFNSLDFLPLILLIIYIKITIWTLADQKYVLFRLYAQDTFLVSLLVFYAYIIDSDAKSVENCTFDA